MRKGRIHLVATMLVLLITVASCGIFPPRGATVISDHEEIEAILLEHFPDLYELHEQGRIEVDEIYVYPNTKFPYGICRRTSTDGLPADFHRHAVGIVLEAQQAGAACGIPYVGNFLAACRHTDWMPGDPDARHIDRFERTLA